MASAVTAGNGWRPRLPAAKFHSSTTGKTVMSFRITGLPAERFAHLFALSDAELTVQGAVRRIADPRAPGYPCRVSLTDSAPGDKLLLLHFGPPAGGSALRLRLAGLVAKGEET